MRYLLIAGTSLILAACASTPVAPTSDTLPGPAGAGPIAGLAGGRIVHPPHPLECVAYVRSRTGMAIFGDAWTWWDQAAGRYPRSHVPVLHGVMVLDGYGGRERAHLAYLSRIDSKRIVRIDHANWLDRGDVFLADPVIDVSRDNDWSEVRVFDIETGRWGVHVFHVRGFISPVADPSRIAYGSRSTALRN